jgi:hypothetical protein
MVDLGFIVMTMKITLFWEVTPCSLVEYHRRLGRAHCLHLQCTQPAACLDYSCTAKKAVVLEMLYFSVILCIKQCFVIVSVHTIRGTDIPYVFTFTACFGLMWPSSGTLGLTITYFFSRYSPYTGQCLHIGSALDVRFYVMPYVAKRIEYLKCYNIEVLGFWNV